MRGGKTAYRRGYDGKVRERRTLQNEPRRKRPPSLADDEHFRESAKMAEQERQAAEGLPSSAAAAAPSPEGEGKGGRLPRCGVGGGEFC
nr:MAG TPA: hypothetical protein [Caudoviricetes sp.]